ncbi:hypothetical protein Q5762_12560 [Streptomyces sp. P9(2023)]|uniref:hypothetical protein n=1 Tax=Streptomyces sp. P9(2023) TaxID=3064394 RepID=UPI0028F3E447|nr:hypothetical protein [Streptomyces sp. P9(2023)]MDT9689158.1 hypothetical protein [Streptomyces sp. P9(2023)]
MVTFRSALAVSGAALGLVALAAVPSATAAPSAPAPYASSAAADAAAALRPAFLSAGQMPPSSTPWTADPVAKGLPETGVFCAPGVLPEHGTRHRVFRTELDTGGVQVTTVAATEAKAAALVDALRQGFLGCGERIERENPGVEAGSLYHGKVEVEEGAYVYSLDTRHLEIGSTDIFLFSVGRDGRTVTYVQWGQLGDLEDAPLTDFRTTTRTAVNKLLP